MGAGAAAKQEKKRINNSQPHGAVCRLLPRPLAETTTHTRTPVEPFSIDFLAVDTGFPLVFPSSDDLGQFVNREFNAGFPAARGVDQLQSRAPLVVRDRFLEADVKLVPYLDPPLRRYYCSRGVPGQL